METKNQENKKIKDHVNKNMVDGRAENKEIKNQENRKTKNHKNNNKKIMIKD
jgi:hypothetical protein